METQDLSCQQLVELVTAYLENTLSEAERTRFNAHLATCEGCTHYVEQMRTTIRLTGKLSEALIEPEPRKVLLETFRSWYRQQDAKPPE